MTKSKNKSLLTGPAGQTSSGRVISLIGALVGLFISATGAVAVFMRIPEGVQLSTIGAGIYLTASGLKGASKFAEKEKT